MSGQVEKVEELTKDNTISKKSFDNYLKNVQKCYDINTHNAEICVPHNFSDKKQEKAF